MMIEAVIILFVAMLSYQERKQQRQFAALHIFSIQIKIPGTIVLLAGEPFPLVCGKPCQCSNPPPTAIIQQK